MIKLQIVGNLGADCIQKEVNGKNVINFNVAHTEKFKDGQGNLKEKTIWVNCAYWTDKTGIAPYLTKGKTVYAEGSPEAEAYTNKDGQLAATLRMRVQTIQLLGGNSDGQPHAPSQGGVSHTGAGASPAFKSSPAPVSTDDDLPF